MDKKSFEKYIEKFFTSNTLPYLMEFVRVPNLSPAYDYEWNTNGRLIKAANLVISFGCGIGETYDINKIKYHNIVIIKRC